MTVGAYCIIAAADTGELSRKVLRARDNSTGVNVLILAPSRSTTSARSTIILCLSWRLISSNRRNSSSDGCAVIAAAKSFSSALAQSSARLSYFISVYARVRLAQSQPRYQVIFSIIWDHV